MSARPESLRRVIARAHHERLCAAKPGERVSCQQYDHIAGCCEGILERYLLEAIVREVTHAFKVTRLDH